MENLNIEVAYSKEQLLDIVKNMSNQGFPTIYVIATHATLFEDIKWQSGVKTYEVGNWLDQFKSWFTGESAVKEGMKRFSLTAGQTAYYAQLVEQGAIAVLAKRAETAPIIIAIDQEKNHYRHNPLEPRVTAPEPFIETIHNVETLQQRENRLRVEESMDEMEQ